METELLVHFAEIAGVFVGFGALISLRSAHVSDPHDVVYLEGVLGLGVWVVIGGLVPVALGQFGIARHTLWLSCALFALVLWVLFVIALNRSPGSRSIDAEPEPMDRFFPLVGLPLHLVMAGSMTLIVVGVRPDLDQALYMAALTAGVVFGGWTLLVLVMSQAPESPQDHAADETHGVPSGDGSTPPRPAA